MPNRALSLPHASVRYVKNGAGGQWWPAAKANGQVHAGWSNIPHELLINPDFALIKQMVKDEFGHRQGSRYRPIRHELVKHDAPATILQEVIGIEAEITERAKTLVTELSRK